MGRHETNLLSMKKIIITTACVIFLIGCKDQDIRVEVGRTSSQLGRRVEQTMGSWEFKYTNKGRWDISCRPPGLMSEFGLNYWTDLKRAPSRDRLDFKVFAGSRNGDKITVIVEKDGSTSVYLNQDGDLITHDLRIYDSSDRGFFRTVFSKN